MVYIFSRLFKKHELCENMYIAKMSTFTVIQEMELSEIVHCFSEDIIVSMPYSETLQRDHWCHILLLYPS